MHHTIISLASNLQQEQHLRQAQGLLAQMLHHMRFTEAIWTEPFQTDSPRLYLNQLVYAQTELTVGQLQQWLKDIELQMGRTPDARRQGIVRIDLDLLQYDGQRYHLRDWDRPYIRLLLDSRD